MNITKQLSRIDPPMLILSAGSYLVYRDYKSADIRDKKKVLLRDSIVLAGTCAGAFAGTKIENKLVEQAKKNIQKTFLSFNKTDIIANMSSSLGGILGGFLAGEITDQFIEVRTHNKHSGIL